MSPEDQEIKAAPGTSQWLQDEVHNAKIQAAKLEQQVDQLQALLSDLVDRTRHHDETLATMNTQLSALTLLQEEVRQLQTLTSRLREEQERARGHAEEAARQQQAENEHIRGERADLARQAQDIERQVAAWQERQNGIEETGKRYQESAAATAHLAAELQQRLDDLEGRAGRTVEAVNRIDQKLPEFEAAMENTLRTAETANERMRLLGDVVRRIESEIADHDHRLDELNELPERIELGRAERQRLETRLNQLEEVVTSLSTARDEHQRLLAALEGKHHGYEGRLDALMERLDEYRRELAEHLLKLTQGQEQQKRRQISDLEREIKELQQHALGLFHE
jgi:chromosome segregation ATPase